MTHPFDPTKKVTTFQLYTPISAHHVGFVVGPFVRTAIADLKRAEDEELAEEQNNTIPISVYTFPDKVVEANNTCIFLYKAMEFFTREYGSYPFSDYSLCFVGDCQVEIASAAALTICSDKLLFPPELIEPLFTCTESLTIALASQWCGINIVPRTWNDLWVTIGISHYMSNLFLRRLLGNNEYRFRLKSRADEICRQDIGKPPLGDPNFLYPITDKDLEFIKLKAPVVLFILDRRMTKTDRSLGLSRVLPKLFLQSMSGDLNSCLSTSHFIKLCERVSHNRLEKFFDQWVFGSGYPIFRVTQRFNKKRMFVEMGIRQVQTAELESEKVDSKSFLDNANRQLDGENSYNEYPVQSIFTGPMTIRIHEADGTPYEHVVEIKDSFTKLDIQYNTKYKRLRRNQRGTSSKAEHVDIGSIQDDEDISNTSGNNGVLLHCLGDVLQSDREVDQWKLSDWDKDDEERMYNEAFEWMRVDSDFEWICKIYINQPDYMYVSQLQQDRDVVAQYEAISFFGDLKPSKLYSTILVRTLMDRRYYYGIRVQSAMALVNMATEDVDYIGKYHLLKAFQESFCFEGSTIPSANNFADFPTYFVQKELIHALSRITDSRGNCPLDVQRFLLDLLRYNENSSNQFSDCYYICELIGSIVDSLKGGANRVGGSSVTDRSDGESKKIVTQAVAEIERCQRMDRWIPSFQNMITVQTINQKRSLAWHGCIQANVEELIQYTRPGNTPDVRLAAFESLISLGGLRHDSIVQYVMYVIIHEPSAYVQNGLIEILGQVISNIALNGEARNTILGDDAKSSAKTDSNGGGLTIVESGTDSLNARREALARTTISGAIEMVRKTFNKEEDNESIDEFSTFREGIWTALTSWRVGGILEKKRLLEICRVLYEPLNSYMVTLPIPRANRLVAKRVGESKIVIKRLEPPKPKIVLLTGGGSTTVAVAPSNETVIAESLVDDKAINGNGIPSPPPPSADSIDNTTPVAPVKRQYKKRTDSIKSETKLHQTSKSPKTRTAVQSRIFKLKIPAHAKELQAAAAAAAMPFFPPTPTPEPNSHQNSKPTKVRLKLKI